MFRKTVGSFTERELRDLADKDHVTVMQPTHDVVFDAWRVSDVERVMNSIVEFTQCNTDKDSVTIARLARLDAEIDDFANKYQVFFSKLILPEYVSNTENLVVLRELIRTRGCVERGELDETSAKASIADKALRNLSLRVKKMNEPCTGN